MGPELAVLGHAIHEHLLDAFRSRRDHILIQLRGERQKSLARSLSEDVLAFGIRTRTCLLHLGGRYFGSVLYLRNAGIPSKEQLGEDTWHHSQFDVCAAGYLFIDHMVWSTAS